MSVSARVAWQCPPQTVLVGVDFGDASARALAVAGIVASASGARLFALHAERFEPPPYFTIEQIAQLEAERRVSQVAAAGHLARFAAAATAYPVETVIADESPVEALLGAAATVDLIVVGTHGRRGPGRWWLGSVAERVVRAATIPVLVTRSATTPPRDVFGQPVFLQDGSDAGEGARSCAEHLARIGSGNLIDGGAVTRCEANILRRASLVVMAVGSDRPSWGITDPMAKVLGACPSPVLFIPER